MHSRLRQSITYTSKCFVGTSTSPTYAHLPYVDIDNVHLHPKALLANVTRSLLYESLGNTCPRMSHDNMKLCSSIAAGTCVPLRLWRCALIPRIHHRHIFATTWHTKAGGTLLHNEVLRRLEVIIGCWIDFGRKQRHFVPCANKWTESIHVLVLSLHTYQERSSFHLPAFSIAIPTPYRLLTDCRNVIDDKVKPVARKPIPL